MLEEQLGGGATHRLRGDCEVTSRWREQLEVVHQVCRHPVRRGDPVAGHGIREPPIRRNVDDDRTGFQLFGGAIRPNRWLRRRWCHWPRWNDGVDTTV